MQLKYRHILDKLQTMTDEELNQDATILLDNSQFLGIFLPIISIEQWDSNGCDYLLDHGHLYFRIDA